MKDVYAQYLIDKTKRDYNKIALDFSNTRQSFWNDSLFLLDYIKKNDKLIDLGCGNGRLYKMIEKLSVDYVGLDLSEDLIKEAKESFVGVNFVVGSALDLPFSDDTFDKVFSMAVLHHIPSWKLRRKFFKESFRVLKKEGLMILTVWNMWGNKLARRKYIFSIIKKLFFGKTDIGDIFYPWKDSKGGVLADRYIHLFKIWELKKLALDSGFKIERYGVTYDKRNNKPRNFYLILKK